MSSHKEINESIFEQIKLISERIEKLEKMYEIMNKKIHIFENTEECNICDKINPTNVCYSCGNKICNECKRRIETKSYSDDTVIRIFCRICYNSRY